MSNIIPAALRYQSDLLDNVQGLKAVLSSAEFKDAAATQLSLIKDISKEVNALKKGADAIKVELQKAYSLDAEKQAKLFSGTIKPLMDLTRASADKLELLVEDESWPLPKMSELLFTN
jgi:glutamine synthetase